MTLEQSATLDPEPCIPAVPHMVVDPAGDHRLMGTRCNACATKVEGYRMACQKCGSRAQLEVVRLGRSGRIYAHTVVHRSLPGVVTPFIAVVVDLDGGGTVRGTLVDGNPADDLPADQRVDLVFRDTGQRDRAGNRFLSYYFVAENGGAA